jgi:hypothetical protein
MMKRLQTSYYSTILQVLILTSDSMVSRELDCAAVEMDVEVASHNVCG